nr:replication associated protein [Banfec virus 3]
MTIYHASSLLFLMVLTSRNWCVTLFKDSDVCWELVTNGVCNYVVKGREVAPTTGNIHWHLYMEFKNRVSAFKVKKMLKSNNAHVEVRRGTAEEAIAYAKKEGDFIERGEPRANEQGKRSDLEDIKRMLSEGADMLEVADKHFGDFVRYHKGLSLYADLLSRKKQREREPIMPEVIVYLGAAGSGKSHHCWNDPEYRKDGYRYMVQSESKAYFDGYDGESVIWFDEFRGSTIPFGVFLQLTDKWGCRVEVKGGSVEIFAKRILISTVEWPSTWWRGSTKYQTDPEQLFRRLSKVYFIPLSTREPRQLDIDGVRVSACYADYLQWESNKSN